MAAVAALEQNCERNHLLHTVNQLHDHRFPTHWSPPLTLPCCPPLPAQRGILDKYGIELIGAKLPSIDRAEDRELFKQSMIRIGQKVPASGESRSALRSP